MESFVSRRAAGGPIFRQAPTFFLLFGFPPFAYACMVPVCETANVCVDGVCSPQQVCWLEDNGRVCNDDGGDGGDDPGVPPSDPPGDGGSSSPYDENGDGKMECWKGVTLNPAMPPATGPYGQQANRFHYGSDITSGAENYGKGSPVLAVASGTVVAAKYAEANGNYVKINHDDGRASYYLHLETIDHTIAVGTHVVPGRMIGTMNCTGNCYSGGERNVVQGTHLHLEIRTSHTAQRAADGSTTIDPAGYLGECP